jgi:hypothetical protein
MSFFTRFPRPMLVKPDVRVMLGCRTFSLGIGPLINGVIDVEDTTLLSLE